MIVDKIMKYETVYIAGHVNPDGDAVGACLAVAGIISSLRKKPIVLLEKYSEKYNYLNGSKYVINEGLDCLKPSLFIALDTSDKERLGKSKALFDKCGDTINIDHHISNPNYAKMNYVDASASSTCEVVYKLLSPHFIINKNAAEALYTGIAYDTGGFRHSSTSPYTYETAAKLMRTGIDFSKIQREVLYTHSVPEMLVFTKAIQNVRFTDNNKISYTALTHKEMLDCGADTTDLDGIVEYILNIRGVSASVFFSERNGGAVKASFRSIKLDVAGFASKYGGGGHENAAGATLYGDIEDCIKNVVSDLNEVLEQNGE